MAAKPYDIFISYRREGGQETAMLFYERQTQLEDERMRLKSKKDE